MTKLSFGEVQKKWRLWLKMGLVSVVLYLITFVWVGKSQQVPLRSFAWGALAVLILVLTICVRAGIWGERVDTYTRLYRKQFPAKAHEPVPSDYVAPREVEVELIDGANRAKTTWLVDSKDLDETWASPRRDPSPGRSGQDD